MFRRGQACAWVLALCSLACSYSTPSRDDITRASTTDGALALRNLSAQITGIERALQLQAHDLNLSAQLIDAYLSRATFLRTNDDLVRAHELAEALNTHHDGNDTVLGLRAKTYLAQHSFEEAARDLETLEESGESIVLALATGDDDLSLRRERTRLQQRGDHRYASLIRLANIERYFANYHQAEEVYLKAIESYRDVSPLPIAWVYFQLGVMYGEEIGDDVGARDYYEKAIDLVPIYVGANIHLAEIEFGLGEVTRALERLRPLVNFSNDAELFAKLGEFGERRLISKAASLYREQAFELTNAFLDHEAEFWLGLGNDFEKAHRLAQRNFELRRVDRAQRLLMHTSHAIGNEEEACAWVTVLLESRVPATVDEARGLLDLCASRGVR